MPFTIFLLTLPFKKSSQARQAFLRSSFKLRKAKPLLPSPLLRALTNEPVFLIQLGLMFSVVALANRDFLCSLWRMSRTNQARKFVSARRGMGCVRGSGNDHS